MTIGIAKSTKGLAQPSRAKEIRELFNSDSLSALVLALEKISTSALEELSFSWSLNKPAVCEAIKQVDSLLDSHKERERERQRAAVRADVLEILARDGNKIKLRQIACDLLVSHVEHVLSPLSIISDVAREIWVRPKNIYVPDGIARITAEVEAILKSAFVQSIAISVCDRIAAKNQIEADAFFAISNPNEIPVLNGVLNIKTKILRGYNDVDKFRHIIPLIYDDTANATHFQSFLETTIPSDDDRKLVLEILAWCLYGDLYPQKMVMFTGVGSNGKSVLLSFFREFLGFKNCSSMPLQDIKGFGLSELVDKVANLCGDIGPQAVENAEILKTLSGSDAITAPRKFRSAIDFKPRVKLIFSCNKLPIISDTSDGMWRRWIRIDFPKVFLSGENYEKRKGEENVERADKEILDKITTRNELSGALNLALEAWQDVQEKEAFCENLSTDEVRKAWQRAASSSVAFIVENIQKKYGTDVPKSMVRSAYLEWCSQVGTPVESSTKFKRAMEENGFADDTVKIDGSAVKIWRGCDLV
jgi:P4 family phage/plasmid primase-like protien